MDDRIKVIREALIKLRAFAKSFDCDYQDECTPGDDDMCQSCKHVYIADQALTALSAIDHEAIRREARAEGVRLAAEAARSYLDGLPYYEGSYTNGLHAAILGAELAQDDGKRSMPLLVVERYADNGAYSHHDVIVKATGETVCSWPAQDDGEPEPGDLVISASSQAVQWNGLPDPWYWTVEDAVAMQDETIVVIRRAAEIKRRINEVTAYRHKAR